MKQLNEQELRILIKEHIKEYLKNQYVVEYNDNKLVSKPLKRQSIDGDEIIDPNDYLDESLIMTYDIEKVKRIICRKFNIHESRVIVSDGLVSIYLPFGTNKQLIGDIKNFMKQCGYYMDKEEPIVNSAISEYVLNFISSYGGDDVTSDIFENYDFLYHATPSVYVNRIMKYGLVPKSMNAEFKYPDRIYLSTRYDKNLFNSLGMVRKINNNIGGTYDVLRVDLDKIKGKVKLYKDKDYKFGVFTFDNISPEAIAIIKRNIVIN